MYRQFIFALATAAITSMTYAQEAWPSKVVTIVVPFSAGASNDAIARYLANRLGKKWNKNVIVENKPGAGGSVGSAQVARAQADGHTLLFMSSAFTTMAASNTPKELGFDAVAEIAPVAMVARAQLVLVTGPTVKAKNFAEFLPEAKSRPLFVATPGVNSASHFASEAFQMATGLKFDSVNYKGGNEAMLDVMAGRADVYFGTVASTTPFLKDGKMRAMSVLSADRATVLPDIPNVFEVGYKDAEFSFWWGMFAPIKTPQAIVDKVNADITALMGDAEGRKFLDNLGAGVSPMAVGAFKGVVSSEITRWTKVADRMKAQAKK